jgi:type III secretory pathway component EscT
VAPALSGAEGLSFGIAFTLQALRGLPVAVSAAAALWTVGMVGGFIDELRQSRELSHVPLAADAAGPLGVLFTLVAAIAFLTTGGPARIVEALSRPADPIGGMLARVVRDLLAGIQVAIAIAVPFLVASLLLDVLTSLLARTVKATSLRWLLVPLRNVVLLLLLAVILDRVLTLVVLVAARVG